jgi:hypothetical protein
MALDHGSSIEDDAPRALLGCFHEVDGVTKIAPAPSRK